MTNVVDSRSCFDVIGELNAAAHDVLTPDQQFYVLGGIATSAIKHPNSVFDHQTDRLIAAPDASEPVIRENGTRRDIDVLVLDVLTPDKAVEVKQTVSMAVGKSLVVSVFGLDHHEEHCRVGSLSQLLKAWTSLRTVDDTGKLRYELYPLESVVSRESFRPWAMELPNGGDVPILNPAAHMLAYRMRSISGLRAKDAEKVEAMERRIQEDSNFMEDINDGALKPWKEFADDLEMLGDKEGFKELVELCYGYGPELGISRLKGKILRAFEGNQRIVRMAQKGRLQTILGKIVGSS